MWSKESSGVQKVFKIWFIYQSFVVFSVFAVSNVYIFFDTKKNNPELWGNVQTNRNINPHGLEIGLNIPRKSIFYIHGMEVDSETTQYIVECDLSVQEI